MAATQSDSLPLFEGDILLQPLRDMDYIIPMPDMPNRWRHGVVPYKIKNTFKQNEIRIIQKAMEEMREGYKKSFRKKKLFLIITFIGEGITI